MEVEKMLDSVQDRIMHSFNEWDVVCTADELNHICSIIGLSTLKLQHPLPVDFIPAQDLSSCYMQCITNTSYYRVLEFIYLSNPCVKNNVEFIFPQMVQEKYEQFL